MVWDLCADRLQEAQRSFESRAFEPAAREFKEALKVCPQRDAILISPGQTQYLAGDEAAAERTLLQEIHETAARYALGRIYYQQGRYVEAAAQLEQVVAREPENYKATTTWRSATTRCNATPTRCGTSFARSTW